MSSLLNRDERHLLQISTMAGFAALLCLGKAELLPDYALLPACFVLVGLAQTFGGGDQQGTPQGKPARTSATNASS